MDVGVDKVLLLVRVHRHQRALVLRATGGLGPLIVLQLVHVLQALPAPVARPAVRTRVLVLHFQLRQTINIIDLIRRDWFQKIGSL